MWDVTDFNTLSSHFDPSGGNSALLWVNADFDADSDVDVTDFEALAANFSPTGYASSNLAFVPEPHALFAAAALTMLSVVGALRPSRHRATGGVADLHEPAV